MAKKKPTVKKKTAKPVKGVATVDATIPPELLLLQAAEIVVASAPSVELFSDWELTEEQATTVERWCSTKMVSNQLGEMTTRDKHEVIDALLPTYVGVWYGQKQQPRNPRLSTRTASCHFIVQPSKLTVELSQGAKTVQQALQAQGLHHQRAKLFAGYVQSKQQDEFVDRLSVMRTHAVEQIRDAANSLYKAMKADPRWSLLIQPSTTHELLDPATFVSDLPVKAKSAEEMYRILQVIRPVAYPSNAIHTAATAAVEKRLGWEREHQVEFFSPDGKYRIVAQQKLVLVYCKTHGLWQHRTTAKRSSGADARQYARKVSQDASTLNDLLGTV